MLLLVSVQTGAEGSSPQAATREQRQPIAITLLPFIPEPSAMIFAPLSRRKQTPASRTVAANPADCLGIDGSRADPRGPTP